MRLRELLSERRQAIANAWLKRVFDTYPNKTSELWRREKNQFANPVGHTLSQEIGAVLTALIDSADGSELATHLEPVVKLRSVQEFTPAEALSFVFDLKGVVRSVLKKELKDPKLASGLYEFDKEIDRLALLSFEIYVACRERIAELRVNEMRRSVHSLLRRAELIVDEQEPERDQDENDG